MVWISLFSSLKLDFNSKVNLGEGGTLELSYFQDQLYIGLKMCGQNI
jgi:hypothetical protein